MKVKSNKGTQNISRSHTVSLPCYTIGQSSSKPAQVHGERTHIPLLKRGESEHLGAIKQKLNKHKKTFNTETLLASRKSYKSSTKNFLMPFTQFPLMLASYGTVAVIKTRKLTLM